MVYWIIICTCVALAFDGWARVFDERKYHLRSGDEAEWQEFVDKAPHGKRLDLRFEAQKNASEQTLIIRQYDVKQEWNVELNGKRLGKLFLMEFPLTFPISIAPGTLRNGENVLSIIPPKENDDIMVGEFTLHDGPLQQCVLDVQVTESGASVPARVTVADSHGYLAALRVIEGGSGRPGVVYTATGKSRIGLLPGEYTVYASRGPEYSLSITNVRLRTDDKLSLPMAIRREVPTPGLVSCDTHVHTFTYAKHGDVTIDERMLTLAGEGVELPISTEHNMLVDFTESAQKTGTSRFFTPVIGCEVTTAKGHFNVFPIQPGSRVPDFRIEDWPRLIENIRATPGVEFAILNHPRDTHRGFTPFAETNLNSATGENLRGFEFTFDGVELINSGALRSDLMQVFHDWFALLNYGYKIVGVGASDSHDLSRFIIGQGRTYIVADDENPSTIDVAKAVANLRQGKALISLGLIANVSVDGRFGPGDIATHASRVTVTVLGPSWAEADLVELYANGERVQSQSLTNTLGRVEKAKVDWPLRASKHDYHLIAIAHGPGIKSPHWAIPKPYQPSSLVWNSRLLGATNPVWVDADGDGQFTSARAYAKRLVAESGANPERLSKDLASYDRAVRLQAASLTEKK